MTKRCDSPSGLPAIPSVSHVRFAFAGDDDALEGLVGFIAFRLDDLLEVACVALRVTRRGEIAFTWPEKPDSRGKTRTVARPATDEARLALEGALSAALFPRLPEIRRRIAEIRALDGPPPAHRALTDRREPRDLETRPRPSRESREGNPP